jgi:hypothetical protein
MDSPFPPPIDPGARVRLPQGLRKPYTIFVNGIEKEEGRDYVVDGQDLLFRQVLRQEGKLPFWRWFTMLLGIMGTYRPNDSVDVVFRHGGKPGIITRLPIETLKDEPVEGLLKGSVSFDPFRR